MAIDPSRGWDEAAPAFMAARSHIGTTAVRRWARQLKSGGAVLDIGCGSGTPISAALIGEGFELFGVDASPTMVAAFRNRFPMAEAACEPAETSPFFHRHFDAALAVGLLFLLPADDQCHLINRVSRALIPGGRFLFTAPQQPCEWTDTLTGRISVSLGKTAYRRALAEAGMVLTAQYVDEGENNYYDAMRPASPRRDLFR